MWDLHGTLSSDKDVFMPFISHQQILWFVSPRASRVKLGETDNLKRAMYTVIIQMVYERHDFVKGEE